MSDGGNGRQQDAMYKEEEKLRKQSEREQERDRERDRKEWEKKAGNSTYLKDLDWFLNRSQVSFFSLLIAGTGNEIGRFHY
jgi:hypothetical protein